MEEEIAAAYPHAIITLIEGSGGVFEVKWGEEILFSKRDLIGTESKRFPHPREINGMLEKIL